ncbi:hypothetical protein [Chengkuizengella axinellae]|uniref:Uncharacterized protein n=1 Tax=Chengkuizengella axinellae TaxID=3064388 RepID=A0ABT9J6Q9_9BACL|nr:hypothetical protein [Chengkuizengella sp. 2205SS18-9]MDP5276690.1 hypothetical protein [Chengkuizengella sp. 2205SS18-9]
MGAVKNLKWVTGGLEALLGIPILGGTIVLSLAWSPLIIMLILHIITLAICSKHGASKAPSIVGIITSCIAWIPVVGMIMHLITAVLLMVSAHKTSSHTNVSHT